jgi:hypothetical protein
VDLKKRLAQLDRLSRRPGPGTPTGDETATVAAPATVLADLGLTEQAVPGGRIWWREYRDRLPAVPATVPDLGHFFPRFTVPAPPAASILFLDTETTGLAGGTGTIPFLIGLSWLEGRTLVTRQLFLPGPGHETAMLRYLGDLSGRFAVVVTFNGASFDLPLLRTRARLNRLEDPLEKLVSWDLLVPCRRLWGRDLENCRQQTLETAVCGIERLAGDIDGARIPQAWFDFLHDGGPGLLPRVLCHNHRDMVGMGQIFGCVLRLAGSLDRRAAVDPGTWRLAWSLGRICEMRKDQSGAAAWIEHAIDRAGDRGETALAQPRFLADAIRITKRQGDWQRVETIIRAGLAAGINDAWLHREAAILYEHRLVRPRIALDHAALAGEDRRVRRLERRLAGAWNIETGGEL